MANLHLRKFCLFLLLTASAYAQTSTGQLSVTALDSTGALIPAATVKLIGSETRNTLRTIQTNGLGVAVIPLVRAITTSQLRLQALKPSSAAPFPSTREATSTSP